jgi:hypothetical protein
VTIPLLRTASIEGTVRNASQQPVSGADVFVRCMASRSGGVPLSEQERSRFGLRGDASHMLAITNHATDEQGRFRIAVMPCGGESEISVFATSYVQQIRTLRVDLPGSTVLADFTLEHGATIRGRATKNGQPWNGHVWGECRELGYNGDPVRKDGEFVFTAVPRGNIVIKLVKPGSHAPEREATVRVTDDGEYRQDFEWTEELSTIAGRVVNPAGQPVPGARVDVHAVFPSGREVTAQAASASDGTFTIEVVAGVSYDVAVSACEQPARASLPDQRTSRSCFGTSAASV